jgi:hypothetical protein
MMLSDRCEIDGRVLTSKNEIHPAMLATYQHNA